jgi:hypothetical protein
VVLQYWPLQQLSCCRVLVQGQWKLWVQISCAYEIDQKSHHWEKIADDPNNNYSTNDETNDFCTVFHTRLSSQPKIIVYYKF